MQIMQEDGGRERSGSAWRMGWFISFRMSFTIGSYVACAMIWLILCLFRSMGRVVQGSLCCVCIAKTHGLWYSMESMSRVVGLGQELARFAKNILSWEISRNMPRSVKENGRKEHRSRKISIEIEAIEDTK